MVIEQNKRLSLLFEALDEQDWFALDCGSKLPGHKSDPVHSGIMKHEST